MKKFLSAALSAAILSGMCVIPISAQTSATTEISYNYLYDAGYGYVDEDQHTRQMETLDRGLVAVRTDDGVFLSWRLFDSEDTRYGSGEKNVSFNIYRNGSKIDTITDRTNYIDSKVGSSYAVAPVVEGVEGEICQEVTVLNNNYFDIPIVKPADEIVTAPDGSSTQQFSFFPADCSTGDLDGDGEYEIVIKWTSSERDVGEPGDPAYSGTVKLAAYKLDGTRLWENDIDLGKNVYSSAHTVQFLVYDFDLDGKSEVVCQTSLGSTDGSGNYVSHASSDESIAAFTDDDNLNADFRGYGRITTGEEFLTVFNGESGNAADTIYLPTTREVEPNDNGASFGDDFGNRSNRFLANIAYLDGEKPYAVYMRGYYGGRNGRQRTSVAGVSFDGETLTPTYRFDTEPSQPGYYEGAEEYVKNGNHNCTVADVDNDGKDEFITGATCYEVNDENNLVVKWCTFLGHGDAMHIGDYDPTHVGFEFFTIHEDGDSSNPENNYGYINEHGVFCNFGMSVIDAKTGKIIFHKGNSGDTGRGVMANIGSGGYYQIVSSAGNYQSNGGTNFTEINNGMSQNFRIFWDGDLYDELLDGTNITNYNGQNMSRVFSANGCTKINGTKSNPALQADLFGDWREEVVYPTTDGNYLRVFTTTTPTEYKIKTLMQDPVYRSGVAAEQTAYNQPPHVGFYMGEELFEPAVEKIEIVSLPEKTSYAIGEELDLTGLTVKAYLEDGTEKILNAYTTEGFDNQTSGDKTITIHYQNKTATFNVSVKAFNKIVITTKPLKTTFSQRENLNTDGLVVTGIFEDGSTRQITDYDISGYDSNTLGEQIITVTYREMTATFNVTVIPASISSINGTYTTSSTVSSMQEVHISEFSGTFNIEHTLKINSMPANGNEDKNSTAGFFVRFMPKIDTNKPGIGAGWYLSSSSENKFNILWKADGRTATPIVSDLNIGEEYKIQYTFSNVGNGIGASVTMTVLDSSGSVINSVANLGLRNMTFSDIHKSLPLEYIQIYNQANSGSTASVTIDNAVYSTQASISEVSGNSITFSTQSASKVKIFAAKYTDGILTDADILTPQSAGENMTVTTSFEPDWVYLWTEQCIPLDVWSK